VVIWFNPLSPSVEYIDVIEIISTAVILDQENKPTKFLYGLFSYRLRLNQVGVSVLVTIYYSDDISGSDRFFIYDTVNGWQDHTQYTTFNPDGHSVTIELRDGGQGDSDGVANGIIVDPGGVTDFASTAGLDAGLGGGCFVATADHIKEHSWLKPIVRVFLMPLVGISYILVRTSLAIIILTGFFIIISVLACYAYPSKQTIHSIRSSIKLTHQSK
jgi:hypothetical protein